MHGSGSTAHMCTVCVLFTVIVPILQLATDFTHESPPSPWRERDDFVYISTFMYCSVIEQHDPLFLGMTRGMLGLAILTYFRPQGK